jgi:serine/threonine protein kinase
MVGTEEQLQAGDDVGRYEIISPLGRGGMGEVYLARDKMLGRRVALKFMPSAVTTDEHHLRRFEQEARAASALNHPNILTIYEIGEVENRRFIAAEFIDGETLRQRMNDESRGGLESRGSATLMRGKSWTCRNKSSFF